MKSKAIVCAVALFVMLASAAPAAAAIPEPGSQRIDVEKYVSMGAASYDVGWLDADSAPGPYGLAGGEVYFKYVVQNVGNVPLDHVQLSDSHHDPSGCIFVEPLMPGAWFECVIGPFQARSGQQRSTATARGWYDGGSSQDSDPVNYFGAVVSIDLENYVSVNGRRSWEDADDLPGVYALAGGQVYYKYRGRNAGNVPLTGIRLEDASINVNGSRCIILEPLMPGATFECVVGPFPLQAGQRTNIASASASFMDWSTKDSDPANCFGAVMQIELEKYVGVQSPDGDRRWYDADSPPGPTMGVGSEIYFMVSGKNAGNVPLESVRLFDSDHDLSRCILVEPLMPGAAFECIVGPYIVEAGQHSSSAVASGKFNCWSTQDEDAVHYVGVYVDASDDRSDAAGERAGGSLR